MGAAAPGVARGATLAGEARRIAEDLLTTLGPGDELLLVPGRYRIDAALSCNGELQDKLEGAVFVDVDHGLVRGWPVPTFTQYGSVVLPHRWTTPA